METSFPMEIAKLWKFRFDQFPPNRDVLKTVEEKRKIEFAPLGHSCYFSFLMNSYVTVSENASTDKESKNSF